METDTGREVRSFTGHRGAVLKVAIAGDDCCAATTGKDGTIRIWDLSWPGRYQEELRKLQAAQDALTANPQDVQALEDVGRWYFFRRKWAFAATLLERARDQGAPVSKLILARSYWRLGRPDDACEYFRAAMKQREAPAEYVQLCIAAVQEQRTLAAVEQNLRQRPSRDLWELCSSKAVQLVGAQRFQEAAAAVRALADTEPAVFPQTSFWPQWQRQRLAKAYMLVKKPSEAQGFLQHDKRDDNPLLAEMLAA